MSLLRIFHFVVAALIASKSMAAHTQATLLLSAETARPGETVWAGVQLKMEDGWHTYWKNPGEAGSPTKIDWTLPTGVTAGEIQWPLPEKLPPAEITTYGYKEEVVLLVPLTLASNLAPGSLELSANVLWLECNDSCIPASQKVQVRLEIGTSAKASVNIDTLKNWQTKVPGVAKGNINAWWSDTIQGDQRQLSIQTPLDWMIKKNVKGQVDFYPDASDQYEASAFDVDTNSIGKSEIRLSALVKKTSSNWPDIISGVLVVKQNGKQEGFAANLKIGSAPQNIETGFDGSSNNGALLWQMLLFAFIGGLILNIMPCVLPVIALKILGFVSEAKSDPRRVRLLGLVYAIGVLTSFFALAAVIIAVKAAGHNAGWGMQFGSPVFVICLTTLVMLVAMNLFGVFEVTLGGRALDTASELSARSGVAGAFFNGVLATTLATPCTAPFLAPALGFAFAQSAPIILLVFLTVGVGLATPYVLLSWNPAWLKFLPKPGAWMEKFKMAMGFPMLATAFWLFSLAAENYEKKSLWLGVFLVTTAAAAWVFGESFQRGSRQKIGGAIALCVFFGGYLFALEQQLDWRHPLNTTTRAGAFKESVDGIEWEPWSTQAVASARAAGKVVLVDFTADWCLTCQVNKKTSIEVTTVRQRLKELGATAFMGDYTRFPTDITAELNRFNRAGVPLVLVYPKNPKQPAIVLPEVLTPGIVLDALDRAAK